MSSVVQIMAAALAQELRERNIAALGMPICEVIVEAMLERVGAACERFLAQRTNDKSRRDT